MTNNTCADGAHDVCYPATRCQECWGERCVSPGPGIESVSCSPVGPRVLSNVFGQSGRHTNHSGTALGLSQMSKTPLASLCSWAPPGPRGEDRGGRNGGWRRWEQGGEQQRKPDAGDGVQFQPNPVAVISARAGSSIGCHRSDNCVHVGGCGDSTEGGWSSEHGN
jgi:hypothetical protein